MFYSFASMDDDNLEALRALEKDIGRPLVALREVELPAARLGHGDLDRIRDLEQRLGVVLLAVGGGEEPTPRNGRRRGRGGAET
jgi:hypothetical protein